MNWKFWKREPQAVIFVPAGAMLNLWYSFGVKTVIQPKQPMRFDWYKKGFTGLKASEHVTIWLDYSEIRMVEVFIPPPADGVPKVLETSVTTSNVTQVDFKKKEVVPQPPIDTPPAA